VINYFGTKSPYGLLFTEKALFAQRVHLEMG